MALANDLNHTRPDGTSYKTAFPADITTVGENIVWGQSTCEEVTEDWKETNEMYSGQGHRRNMLYTDFNAVGIAGYKLNGVIWWAQDFGYVNNINEGEIIYPNTNPDEPTVNPNSTDKGTFTELNELIQNASENSIIKLDKDYYYDNNADSDFDEGINIIKSLTIDGQGHEINAKTGCRIFSITSTIIIKNIKFINGCSSSIGGAIYSDESVLVKNCTFINNFAYLDGSAIYANEVTTLNSTFINNFAYLHGGAIYANEVTSLNSTFINNTVENEGGAIFARGNSSIIQTTFINNTAENEGGAIFARGNSSIIQTTFINNTAKGRGGAIYYKYSNSNVNSKREIINSTFIDNKNQQIHNEYDTLIDINNKFVMNDDGYSNYFINVTQDNYIIKLDKDYTATTTIFISGNNVTIDGNNHIIDGMNKFRIFYITGKNVTIQNINLINAYGNEYYEYDGGAIYYADGSSGYIINSTFINNTASYGGGAINYAGNSSGVILNSRFINNHASYGGAIYYSCKYDIYTDDAFKSIGIIENTVFINNTSRDKGSNGGGAVYYVGLSNGTIINSTFNNNYAYGAYGNNIAGNSNCTVINSTFINPIITNDSWGHSDDYGNYGNITLINPKIQDYNESDLPDNTNKNTNNNANANTNTNSKTTKLAIKITAKKATFKAKKKSKKYTITLKAGKKAVKKVVVYLKIGKKTYKATTKSNGKAIFNIKLNKKGTYKAKITFKGNKNYNKATKTVQIKIK